MSLVNDMLLDLEARKSTPGQGLEHGLEAARQAPVRRWPRIALCAGAILLIGLSATVYRQLPELMSKPQNPLVSTASASAVLSENVAAASVEPTNVELTNTPPSQAAINQKIEPEAQSRPQLRPQLQVPVVAESVSAKSDYALQESALQELLGAADQALADNRLTQPPVINAYALYRHVLLLQADNRRAHAGIGQIQERYAQLIRRAIKRGNLSTAKQYLQRAELVGMSAAQLQSLEGLLKQARTQLPAAPAVQNTTPGDQVQTQFQTQSGVGKLSGEGETTQPGASSASIEVSWRSREAAALARASLLQQSGDQAGAIAVLRTLVANYPQAESAALRLFDLYLQTGQTTAAGALQTVAQTVPLRHYYQARLLVMAHQNDEASAILEELSPSGAVRQPYLALQAGLYQRNSQFQRAADLYRQLVQMDNRQPTWWLGLGVAMEALGQREKALQAFVAADQLAPADPAVDRYIKQRIQALSNP